MNKSPSNYIDYSVKSAWECVLEEGIKWLILFLETFAQNNKEVYF